MVTAGPGVEDDRGAPARRPVLLADHQLAGLGRGRPVDAAQVVAVAVGADRDVVLAVQGDHVRDGALGADAAAGRLAAAERHDLGQHEDVAGPGDRGHPGAQPERVPQPDAQRPEPVPTADVGAHRVVHLLAVTTAQPRHDEARPVAERVVELLLGHQQRAGGAAGVLDAERDQRLLVDLDPSGHARCARGRTAGRGGASAAH